MRARTCSVSAWCSTRWPQVNRLSPELLPRSSSMPFCTSAPTSPVRLNRDVPPKLERDHQQGAGERPGAALPDGLRDAGRPEAPEARYGFGTSGCSGESLMPRRGDTATTETSPVGDCLGRCCRHRCGGSRLLAQPSAAPAKGHGLHAANPRRSIEEGVSHGRGAPVFQRVCGGPFGFGSGLSGRRGEPVPIPTPENTYVWDISPDRTSLLLGINQAVGQGILPLWTLPTLGGSPRRLGEIKCHGAARAPNTRKTILCANGQDLYLAGSDRNSTAQAGESPRFRELAPLVTGWQEDPFLAWRTPIPIRLPFGR